MSEQTPQVRPFSQVIRLYCAQMGYKLSDIINILKEHDIAISKSSFYDYAKGSAVPTYEKARQIFLALNIKITDADMINTILQASRQTQIYLDSQGSNPYALQGSYSIPWLQVFTDARTSSAARSLFDQRVARVARSVPDYISRLIREDLKNHILPDIEKGDNYGK